MILATRNPVYTFTRIIPLKIHTNNCKFAEADVESLSTPGVNIRNANKINYIVLWDLVAGSLESISQLCK